MNFPIKAQKIWSEEYIPNSFTMFRKKFSINEFKDAHLHISTCHYYSLFINGINITRLFHRYFDFSKQYQDIDIGKFLIKQSQNTIALLCYDIDENAGLMAELLIDNEVKLYSNSDWKCKICNAYNNNAPSHALLFLIEEQYDARLEENNWENQDFDDSGWEKCVVKSSTTWKNFNKSTTCGLSYEPILGKFFVATQLAKTRSGIRHNLIKSNLGVSIFATLISCNEDAEISLFANNNPSVITMDGNAIELNNSIHLPKGQHLLMLTAFTNIELLIHSNATLKILANHLTNTNAEWAVMVIKSKDVKFPWHEVPDDIIAQTPQINDAHLKTTVQELKETFITDFSDAEIGENSSLFNVLSQEYFMPDNGFLHPLIKNSQQFSYTNAKLELNNKFNLLHLNNEPCIINCTNGYDVNIIIDLGHEYIGYVDIELETKEKTVIEIQCFELIDELGCYYMDNHNGFSYICKDGYQKFTSNYRRGCRYISVTIRNITAPVKFYNISLLHNVASVEKIGSFECDNQLINKIYEMSRDTAELCMLDTYVDCPGHEQNFWVGDARITALINLLNFGKYDFNQHSIRMVGQSLSKDYVKRYYPNSKEFNENKFLSMAAYVAYPPESSLPMWSYLWVMQCYDHYIYSGNMDDLKENYGYVKNNLENSILLTNERDLLDYPGAWNLIEWAANDLSPYGEVTANNIFLAKSYVLASKMAKELNKEEDAVLFENYALKTIAAINQYCWDESRQAYVDTVRDIWAYDRYLQFCDKQGLSKLSYEDYLSLSRISEQTNCLALLYDIAPKERVQKILPILTRVKNRQYVCSSPSSRSVGCPKDGELIDNIVAVGSPFFLFFTIEALFKTGNEDIAIEIMQSDWGDMLKHGTNTCWETFKAKSGHYTRSIAHAWSASPAIYLQQNVLGIVPLSPGYKEFSIFPCKSDISWAKGSVATPYGPIYASWEKDENGKLTINFNCPPQYKYIK